MPQSEWNEACVAIVKEVERAASSHSGQAKAALEDVAERVYAMQRPAPPAPAGDETDFDAWRLSLPFGVGYSAREAFDAGRAARPLAAAEPPHRPDSSCPSCGAPTKMRGDGKRVGFLHVETGSMQCADADVGVNL